MGSGGGGDSTQTIVQEHPPYVRNYHWAVMKTYYWDPENGGDGTGLVPTAAANNPFEGYEDIETDVAFFGTGYLISSFPSLWDMYGKFMAGLDIETLWTQTFADTVNSSEVDNLVAAEGALMDDDIEDNILPRLQTGMRDMNSVMASTYVIGRSLVEDARVKQLEKFSAQLRYNLIPVAQARWVAHLDWNKLVIATYAELFKLYYSVKTDTDEVNYTMKSKEQLWPFTVWDYSRIILGSLSGASQTTKDVAGSSNTQKVLAGAMSGASMGAMIGSNIEKTAAVAATDTTAATAATTYSGWCGGRRTWDSGGLYILGTIMPDDSTTTIIREHPPYVRNYHWALMKEYYYDPENGGDGSGVVPTAAEANPYDEYDVVDVENAFFGTGYTIASFEPLMDMFGRSMAGMDIEQIWTNVFNDRMNKPEISEDVKKEITLLDQEYDKKVIPEYKFSMREVNAVNSSTYVIGMAKIESQRVKQRGRLMLQSMDGIIPLVNTAHAREMNWLHETVTGYGIYMKQYYMAKTYVSESNYRMNVAKELWDVTVWDYCRKPLAALKPLLSQPGQPKRKRSETSQHLLIASQAITGLVFGATWGWVGAVVGAIVGKHIGIAQVLQEQGEDPSFGNIKHYGYPFTWFN